MNRYPRIVLALLAGAALWTTSYADHVPLNLRYNRISLANGRILKDVTLNSINRETGLVYVLEDQRLRPYPLALFPTFVAERVDAQAAEQPPPTARANHAPAPNPQAGKATTAPKHDTAPAAIAARDEALLEAVAAKAQQAALNHLRYKIKTGSGYTTVTDADLDLNPPEPVAGWSNRFRVRGDGYYSYYESVGGAFHRRTRGVEVLLEATSPTRIKVLEINTTWGSLQD